MLGQILVIKERVNTELLKTRPYLLQLLGNSLLEAGCHESWPKDLRTACPSSCVP